MTTGWRFLAPPPGAPVEPRPLPPSFSVVIAAYNVAPYIGAAVSSALGQTSPPHEVIVCDDGSTDDLDVALAPHRDRITLIRQANGGEGSAKNAGVRAASGDFVSILDGDDEYDARRLEALGALARERPDLDILSTDATLVAGAEVLGRHHQLSKPFAVDDQRATILNHNFIPCPAVRRSSILAVGGFDEGIRYATDWDCWLRMIHSGSLAGFVDAPLVVYRQRPGQLTGDQLQLRLGELELLAKAARMPGLADHERRSLGAAVEVARFLRAREAIRRGDPSARRAALAVVFDTTRGHRTRARAALAVASPRWVRSLEARRPSGLSHD